MKKIALGNSDFKTLIDDNRYFVDKSLLIKEVLDDSAQIVLIPRPRRFGKTLNLSMIRYFVENKKCNFNLITWHKTNPVPACGNKYLTDTEYCLFFREKGVKIYGEFSTKFTYYVTPKNVKDKKLYNKLQTNYFPLEQEEKNE